jgi:predicted acyltransferase (DUF342 family)
MDIGYPTILGLFVGMIILCFLWGIWEWKKPADSGPLFIDLDRTIEKKMKKNEYDTSRKFAYDNFARSTQALMQADIRGPPQSFCVKETIRVRGDLRIAKGEIIHYNMIVEGDLISQEDVTFQGGLHVKGRAVLGPRNRLEKSIVCQKELVILEDVIVCNCIDCEGLVFIKSGLKAGRGPEGGGVVSAKKVYLESAEGPLEIHSKERISIVGTLQKIIPAELKETVEVKGN